MHFLCGLHLDNNSNLTVCTSTNAIIVLNAKSVFNCVLIYLCHICEEGTVSLEFSTLYESYVSIIMLNKIMLIYEKIV